MRKSVYTAEALALAALLKSLREGAGLSQRALAARLKRPASLVASVELGDRRLDLVELRDYLAPLGVPLGEFVARLEAAWAALPKRGRKPRSP